MNPWIPSESTIWMLAQATASGSEDSAWENWQRTMQEYQSAANFENVPKLNFWIVISLPGNNYSNQLEWHPTLPMLVPVSGSGKLMGIAQSKDELDRMVTDDTENVHLTYRVKIQGQQAWRNLLEFMAEHDMLEKE